jgi:hypothetical protein
VREATDQKEITEKAIATEEIPQAEALTATRIAIDYLLT